MPGLVVIATKASSEGARAELARMVETLRHEPSYLTGTWCDETIGIYVGWSARPGSLPSSRPLSSPGGNLVLVFSGEEYSSGSNGAPRSAADASHVIESVEEDPRFPASLNGRFHGILINRSLRSVMVFNDRFGIHRLYWHQANDAIYFAAEAKAILAVRPELRRLQSRSLAEFITLGCVTGHRSLFEQIEVLPPASAWMLQDGRVSNQAEYFRERDWESLEQLSPRDFHQKFLETFRECLPRYVGKDEHIGMSLTGGLDTRLIMACGEFQPESLPCYSFGGMFRECRDVQIARRVARACKQSHAVITVGKDFVSRFPHYAERSVFLTDGCVRVTHAPDLYVNQIAGDVAPVRLTGNYGGEILRGVRAFKYVPPMTQLFARYLQPHFESSRQAYAGLLAAHPVSFAAFRQMPWHHYGLLALEQTQLAIRSPFLDNRLVKLAFQAPGSVLDRTGLAWRVIAEAKPDLAAIPTDRGVGGPAVLQKFWEFTAKAEYAFDYGMPQWLARANHALSSDRLDRMFLGRHKFYHYRYWYQTHLREYVRDVLFDSRSLSRPYVEAKTVQEIVSAHLCGVANYTKEIHTLLTLELIHRQLLEE